MRAGVADAPPPYIATRASSAPLLPAEDRAPVVSAPVGDVARFTHRPGSSPRKSLATSSDWAPICTGRWGNEVCCLPAGITEQIPRKCFDGTNGLLTFIKAMSSSSAHFFVLMLCVPVFFTSHRPLCLITISKAHPLRGIALGGCIPMPVAD